MRKSSILLTMLIFFLMVFPLCKSLQAEMTDFNGIIHKKFKLLPGKSKDPYLIYVPFDVKRAGRVRVYTDLTVTEFRGDKGDGMPSFQLVDARIFKKVDEPWWLEFSQKTVDTIPTLNLVDEVTDYIVKETKEFFGKEDKPKWLHGKKELLDKRPQLVHDIDDDELKVTKGRYVVILKNPSKGEFHGSVLISFPGDEWKVDRELEATYDRKPDLAVKSIEIDRDNHVVITLANNGPGRLHKARYNKEGDNVIKMNIEINGNRVLTKSLGDIDPKYNLEYKGGSVTYRTDILLSEKARVMVHIDADDVVIEPDERNNIKREVLIPKGHSNEPSQRSRTKRNE